MLSFFRINDPYRLIGVFLILVLFRFPFWLSDLGLTVPQLNWIVASMRLSEGATMYSGVWDSLSPLSAGFYWLTYTIFSGSMLFNNVLSVLIIFFQAAIFNTILISKGAFNENTYIPAAIYVVLASLYFDFFTVSPVMLGLTFILLALNNIFGQIEIRAKRDEKLLSTGLYFGVATLFHFPFVIFGITILFVFALFTATVRRRYLLYLFGFLLPIILCGVYYYFNDSFSLYLQNHVLSWFTIDTKVYVPNKLAFAIIGFVSFFLIISFLRILQRARLTNYQSRLIQAMLFILILSGSILLIESDRNAYILLTFVPMSAFFISHFFMLTKKGLVSEILFMIFVLSTAFFNYKSLTNIEVEGIFEVKSYFVQSGKVDERLEDRKICVLGDSPEAYMKSYPATPFVNWRLSEGVFKNSDKYRNLTLIAEALENDKPEIIIDSAGLMKKFFEQAPGLSKIYRKEGQFYFRLTNN